MKVFLVVVALVLVAAEEPITINYHEEIGIPEATRIKRAEEAQDFDGSRIFGGRPSALGAHPYFAGLIMDLQTGERSICGASILSNTRLVTAAHCWRSSYSSTLRFTVVLASTRLYSGGVRIVTNNVQMHGNYNQNNLNNDIAIITIPHVNYNNNIRPINIASGSNNYAGTWGIATGFGAIGTNPPARDPVQMEANLQVITNSVCANTFGPGIVISSTLCTSTANGQSICIGDSGGPLAIGSGNNRVLIGITSFMSGRGCTSGQPAGFARVSSFASWIRARI